MGAGSSMRSNTPCSRGAHSTRVCPWNNMDSTSTGPSLRALRGAVPNSSVLGAPTSLRRVGFERKFDSISMSRRPCRTLFYMLYEKIRNNYTVRKYATILLWENTQQFTRKYATIILWENTQQFARKYATICEKIRNNILKDIVV